MTIEEMDKITGAINTAMKDLKLDFDQKIHDGFEMLNNTLNEKIKSRVSDATCELHRSNIREHSEKQSGRIIVLETRGKIAGWALGVLIPIAILGLVYGILMYQKVEDLRIILNNGKPPITLEK